MNRDPSKAAFFSHSLLQTVVFIFSTLVLLCGLAEAQGNAEPARPGSKLSQSELQPFGANLFQGQFGADQHIGLNPHYKIMPGDEITVSMWGAVDFHQQLTVDNQGNIFIPDIGPVPVQGVHYAELTSHVKKHVRSQYKSNVNVYINLLGTQPVSVYVTGAVTSPGRYSGVSSYSALHYIDMAQGIDLQQGSFRQIEIIRDGETLTTLDLYRFLLQGELPKIQLHEGDTIFVHRQGMTVAVEGEVKNGSLFEFTNQAVKGRNVRELAKPLPEATHVLIQGMRSGSPFSTYMSLEAFAGFQVREGDDIRFQEGVPEDLLLVNIQGQHKGPRTMVVPEDAHLLEVLRHIPVDPALANTDAVFLRRQSVAQRQEQALDESLRRLESSVLSTGTMTEEATKIQAQQAKMVQEFVSRAREVEPEGRMVVSTDQGIQDVLLEDGDTIVVPRDSNLVHVNGEVMMPRAVIHQPGKNVDFYINRSGGFTQRADDDRIVLLRANGEAVLGEKAIVKPGDEVMVLPKIPSDWLQITKDVADIVYKIAIAAAVPFRF